ncbi:MAG: hypothetical protein WD029_07985 [Microthrixaceae bacterium]
MNVASVTRHLGKQGGRFLLLALVILGTGVGLGLALAYPVSRVQFQDSDAVRLDQARLAGKVDPDQALAQQGDFAVGWEVGDPSLSSFGLLGSDFCGEAVELPTEVSPKAVSVFAQPAKSSVLISEAVRVDGWQSATDYVDSVSDALGKCDEFYRTDLTGARVQVEIKSGPTEGLVTDQVSRRFVASDGSNVQVWSIMAVGDVIVSLDYIGPAAPQKSLLRDLERKILLRVAPENFAIGGAVVTSVPTGPSAVESETTVIEGGAADEFVGDQPSAEESSTTLPG